MIHSSLLFSHLITRVSIWLFSHRKIYLAFAHSLRRQNEWLYPPDPEWRGPPSRKLALASCKLPLQLPGTILSHLALFPILREIVWNAYIPAGIGPQEMFEMIGDAICRVEGIRMQISGVTAPGPCVPCSQRSGIFNHESLAVMV